MKKLISQFIKFAGVGFLCFLIDYGVFRIVTSIVRGATNFVYSDLIGNVFGFTISVVVNYVLSMRYVFTRKEGMDKKKEFTIFVILSIIGGILNTLIIWVIDHPIYESSEFLRQTIQSVGMMENIAKIIATAIVMVYNFVSRKIFLEEKEDKN